MTPGGSARGVARDAAVQFRIDVSKRKRQIPDCIALPSFWASSRLRRLNMLWTIAVVLALLWLLGMVSNYTLGGFVHLLLVLAIASVLIRVIQGRRAV
jgi:uncharacterized protein DUF5670